MGLGRTKIDWGIPGMMTWTPAVGCSKCSPGCEHCYAERIAVGNLRRMRGINGATARETANAYAGALDGDRWSGRCEIISHKLDDPFGRKKPTVIFAGPMTDLFHLNMTYRGEPTTDAAEGSIIARARDCQNHFFLFLTKRSREARRVFDIGKSVAENIGLGVSVCEPDEGWKLDDLRAANVAFRFASFEPLLWSVHDVDLSGLDWVICGGESGVGARKMEARWAEELRQKCAAAGIPFFFKQWGDHPEAGANVKDRHEKKIDPVRLVRTKQVPEILLTWKGCGQ